MTSIDLLPRATTLSNAQILLEPLRIDHADEMAAVLGDAALYSFTGGCPPKVGELRRRYATQVVGHSQDNSQRWLNWVVRRRDNNRAVGFVQATVISHPGGLCAQVSWVIDTQQQRRGFAQAAAQLMTDWLRLHDVVMIVAHIHPEHDASAAVAQRIGLRPTDLIENGERRWQS